MSVIIAEKVFKFQDQKSQSWPNQSTCNGIRIHLSGVVDKAGCLSVPEYRHIIRMAVLWLCV